MEHIHANQRFIKEKIATRKPVIILLDLDGTRAPIASSPEAAGIAEETKEILLLLSGLPGYQLAIITGRSARDAKNRLDIDQAIYAGNNGLEIRHGQRRWVHPAAANLRPRLARLTADLALSKLASIPGMILEDNGLSLSIRYRQAARAKSLFIKSQVRAIFEPYRDSFQLISGEKAFEVRPDIYLGKRAAVNSIRQILDPRRQGQVIFISDDHNDEDAFSALRPGDIGIRVGHKESSAAAYFVRDTDEVAAFLGELARQNAFLAASSLSA